MQTLEKLGDELSPKITLDHLNNKFVIAGESRPENPVKYFEPIFAWFNEYFNYAYVLNDLALSNKKLTNTLDIELEYFNSTSAKVLFDLLMLLKTTGEKKFNIVFEVNWHYDADDVDMLDTGKEMENLCGLKFNYISKA